MLSQVHSSHQSVTGPAAGRRDSTSFKLSSRQLNSARELFEFHVEFLQESTPNRARVHKQADSLRKTHKYLNKHD